MLNKYVHICLTHKSTPTHTHTDIQTWCYIVCLNYIKSTLTFDHNITSREIRISRGTNDGWMDGRIVCCSAGPSVCWVSCLDWIPNVQCYSFCLINIWLNGQIVVVAAVVLCKYISTITQQLLEKTNIVSYSC